MRFFSAFTTLLIAGSIGCQSDKDIEPADCLVRASSRNGAIIEDSYIVTYKPAETLPATTDPNARVGSAVQRFLTSHAIEAAQPEILFSAEKTAFVAHINKDQAAELRQDPSVELVEPDRIISLCSCVDLQATTTLSWNVKATGYGRGDIQKGKTVWVLDTGVDLDHPDLNIDTDRSRSYVTGKTVEDENGHGTHVAGIIGALNNNIGITGVASGANLVALKILDNEGEGKLSTMIQAVSYVNQNGKAGDVVNISIGGEGYSSSLERVVKAAADKGILFAIAAGNESKSASDYSPASINHPNVFTVSAMDQNDTFASFSNYGPDVDICAYGVRIRSTYKNGQYATLSGTSMAAPHVAGLLYIRGAAIPTRGPVKNDPDGSPDPMAGEATFTN
ncbi:S8 family serine peptidase [Tellurirhabdus bombi]|uniref:S8 family serine peptidase n=1 Tax=Tellurirhabdus bombi TaxID=2907205 RepID=UPI001F1BE1A3|nr:S8 family serine peptidase [Tellurirhabdus bombi]